MEGRVPCSLPIETVDQLKKCRLTFWEIVSELMLTSSPSTKIVIGTSLVMNTSSDEIGGVGESHIGLLKLHPEIVINEVIGRGRMRGEEGEGREQGEEAERRGEVGSGT